jgi:hypothetical protein
LLNLPSYSHPEIKKFQGMTVTGSCHGRAAWLGDAPRVLVRLPEPKKMVQFFQYLTIFGKNIDQQ